MTRTLFGLFLAGALALAVSDARAADTKVTLAQTSAGLGFSPVQLALAEGFFKKHGLDVEVQIVSHGDSDTLAALHSGDVQFGAMTLIPALQGMARGEKLQIVSPFVREFVVQFVINPDAAKKIGLTDKMPLKEKFQRAKGMTVGTLDVGGGLHILFRAQAKAYGLDPEQDFTVTSINSYPSLLAAAQRGQIDIALTAIPFGRLGVRDEGLLMFADYWGGAVPEFDGAYHQGLVVPADYARKNPDVVKRMHAAMDDALQFLHAQPDKAVADLHQAYPKLPEDIIRSFIVGDAKSYAPRAIVGRKGFAILRDFVANSVIAQAASLDYASSVVPEAQEK